jgi:glucose/arabinose dehydrogenase
MARWLASDRFIVRTHEHRNLPTRLVALMLLQFCVGVVAQASTESLTYVDQSISINGESRTARVPQGYRLELVTAALDGPRLMTFSENGDLFIGSQSGHVYRLPPPYTAPEVLVEFGGYPHSVALRKGEILIARTDGVYRAPYRLGQKKLERSALKLLAPLPAGGGHSSRSVGVGPDGRVYASLGINANCTDQYLGDTYPFADRRGGVLVLRADGKSNGWETYGSGLRNPVGFAWHPLTGAMYASNNGPDHWGYELPPEYFSRIDAGSFHGMPWYQFDGRNIKRDDCIGRAPPRPILDVTAPAATFPARNAPMGVAFVPKGAMDKKLEFDAIVALHGSWATRPSGGFVGDSATRRPPKVVVVRFENGQAKRVDDLVTGFQLSNGDRWARPIGVAVGPDGALYFTSDSETHGLFRLKKVR